MYSFAGMKKSRAKKKRKTNLKAGKAVECSWNSLPSEIQSLVLSHLDDQER